MRANNDAVADLIPVDVVINLTLAAGWYTAVHKLVQWILLHITYIWNTSQRWFNGRNEQEQPLYI